MACTLSLQMVFAECGIGAIVLTLNAVLLGGEIVFFQSLCLLGYCLFPICVSAIICASIANKVGGPGCCWGGKPAAWGVVQDVPTRAGTHTCPRAAGCEDPCSAGWLDVGLFCDHPLHRQCCATRVGAAAGVAATL
jgi:hypothetical protein